MWSVDMYKWRCMRREGGKCVAGVIVIESPFAQCVNIVVRCDGENCSVLCTDEAYD